MDAQSIPSTPISKQRHSIDASSVLTDLSPERVNRQHMVQQLGQSVVPSSPAPSVGSPFKSHLFQDPFLSSRRGSDVQGKVAQFNNLSRSNSQRKQELEKALERARLGREQAEAENEMLKSRIAGYVERERRVGLRMEETMEENEKLQSDLCRSKEKYERAKEALTHSKERFREELRRMKGAEFKADSNQLAAQQALQSERQLVKSLELELHCSRGKHDQMEKESFVSQIKLLEMDEQLARLEQQVKLVEEERDALKTSLKSEEVARIAAEGRIALPVSAIPDEFSSPKKRRKSQIPTPTPTRPLSRAAPADAFESSSKKRDEEIVSLKRQLEIESLSRKSAEDLVHFMKLECQLKRCSCRLAEDQGAEYVCDSHFETSISDMQVQYEAVHRQLQSYQKPKPHPVADFNTNQQTPSLIDLEDEIEFSPETGTFRTVKSPQKQAADEALFLLDSDTQEASPDRTVVALTTAAIISEQNLSSSIGSLNTTTADICQILIPDSKSHNDQLMDSEGEKEEIEEAPTTPKVYVPRVSDADLLSFTPFVLPPQSQTNQPPNPHQSTTYQPTQRDPRSQHSSTYPSINHQAMLPLDPQPPAPQSQTISKPPKLQTITTTTTIPLASEPTTPPPSLATSTSAPAGLTFTPATTKSREEALACIRSWRKGNAEAQAAMACKDVNVKITGANGEAVPGKQRSRSVVLSATPARRKWMGNGERERERERDVSAPMRM